MRNHTLIMKPRLTFYSNLIKIPVFKDMVFWSLNERFMPNRTGDIFRVCRDASDNNTVSAEVFTLPTRRLVPLDKTNLKLMQVAHLRNFD